MPKLGPRNPERSSLILEGASRLLLRYGYDKTTVDDIAREAHVSKGAIYLHWKSKDELIDALILREMDALVRDVGERIEADPEGGRLSRMYAHALGALAANPLARSLYSRDARILGDYARRQEPGRYSDRFAFGVEFAKALKASGALRLDIEPEAAAYAMSLLALGYLAVEELMPDSAAGLSDHAKTEAIVSLVQGGLEARGEGEGKQAILELIELVERQYAAAKENKS
jgi:AcrR family transcriptional regulator